MRLESARDLKTQLLADVVAPLVTASTASIAARSAMLRTTEATDLAVAARARTSVPAVQRSVALGVAKSGKGYRLAIRVQRAALLASPLVERLQRAARGEADVRMIGRIDKRARIRVPVTASAATGVWYRANARPLLIGSSIAHERVTAGTLGCAVTRGARTFLLSNNHVLANEDDASTGDWILQRAPLDGGRQSDRVAQLAKWIRLKRRGTNFVDAALAGPTDGIESDPTLLSGLINGRDKRLAGLGPDFLDERERVYKVGRTTGATAGRVTAFDLDNVVVNYDVGNLRFDAQIEIEGLGQRPFSDGGDSGSLIVNSSFQAVALLFAGGDTGGSNGLGLTYANPIHRVLGDLGVALLS